ncbi:MAG: flagellin FliC3 [Lachnospiraceae bacterium]|nr:flagellin FliC3 [Lachnospiraceae bacterium]
MRINYNVSAMLANNALANNDDLLSQSLERLSSGLQINHAKDNPAGLAMSKRMNAQIEGVSTAGQNASDGISVIEIADGALNEVADMLQRMNELAVKSANETMTDEDREVIQQEVEQLKEEIERVSETTQFNGQNLLDGEFSNKGYTSTPDIKVSSYSDEVSAGEYIINSLTVSKSVDEDGIETYTVDSFEGGDGFPDEDNIYTEMKDGILTIKSKNGDGFELKLDLSSQLTEEPTDSYTASDVSVDITGIGSMVLQIGANEGQVLEIDIPAMNLKNMGIEKLDVSTEAGANDGINRIKDAISYVSEVRGKLGAYQNRLESTVDSLDITNENVTAAYSRIMDVDMAEEMTNYTTYQVLVQAGTSMLAQANERPSQVLQLLQ